MNSIFITGGTSGIGESLAKHYLSRGYRVAICGRSEKKFNSNFQNYSSDQLTFFQVDVTIKRDLLIAIKQFAENGLDILITCAGGGYKNLNPIPDFAESERVFYTNFHGVEYAFEGALGYMLEKRKGHLVAISSLSAYAGLPQSYAYSAAKSAVRTMCETFSIDLEPYGINVTCILPGFVRTDSSKLNMLKAKPFEQNLEQATNKIVNAIEKKKVAYAFPLIPFLGIRFLSIVPRRLYVALVRRLNPVKGS